MNAFLIQCAISFTFLLIGAHAAGQSVSLNKQDAIPSIRSSSTLVVVPTLVRSAEGNLVQSLNAADFRITDNGVAQEVHLEHLERQPMSLVVLMQTGDAAARQFANYAHLETMIENLTGRSAYRAAMVTFDSRPEDIWDFTPDAENLRDGFTHPVAGDGKAAIVDAVDFGIELLRHEPVSSRRVLVLLSQTQDDGSKTPVEEVVQRLGESNIVIYTLTFSPEKTWLKDQFTKPRHENAPYQMSPDHAPILHTFDLSTPLLMAVNAMRSDTPSEIAALSGGESMQFSSRNELERQINILANHLASRYTLSFQPVAEQSGFHALRVDVLNHAGMQVLARTSYWASRATPP